MLNTDVKLTPDLLLAQYLTKAFEELIKEAVHDGFHKEYGCGVDDLWSAIPSKFKTEYQVVWDKNNEPIPKDTENPKRRNYEKLMKKRQLISDAIASQRWLFREGKKGLKDLVDDDDIGDYYDARHGTGEIG